MSPNVTVAIAYSEAIQRHVFVFYADRFDGMLSAEVADAGEEEALRQLANPRSLKALLSAAQWFGPLFSAAHRRVGAELELRSGYDASGYTSEQEAERETGLRPYESFCGRATDLKSPKKTALAREFYGVAKPTRAQVNDAGEAILAAPFSGDDLSVAMRDVPVGLCFAGGPFAEPLSDWAGYGRLLYATFRFELECLRGGSAGKIFSSAFGGTSDDESEVYPMVQLPLPSRYGSLLEKWSTAQLPAGLGASGLIQRADHYIKVSARAEPMVGVTVDEVESLIRLNLRDVHAGIKDGSPIFISGSLCGLVYQKFVTALSKGRVGICQYDRCERLFIGKRRDARNCSASCASNASARKRHERRG